MAEAEGHKLFQKPQEPKLKVLGVLIIETSSQGVFRFFCEFCRLEMTRFSRVEREVHFAEQHFYRVLLLLNNQRRREQSKRESIFPGFCYFCNSIPPQGESLVVHLGSKHQLIYDVIPLPCHSVTPDLASDDTTSVGNLDENTAEFDDMDSPEMNFHELGRPDTQTLLMPDTQTPLMPDTQTPLMPDTQIKPNIIQKRGNPTEYIYDERVTTSQEMKTQHYGSQISNFQGFNVSDSHGINMMQYNMQNPNFQSFNEPGPSGINMNQYSTPNINVQEWKESGSCGMNMNQYRTQNPDYQRFNEPGPSGINLTQYNTPNVNVQGWKESGSCGMNMNQCGTQISSIQRFNEPGSQFINHQPTEYPNLQEYIVPSSKVLNMTQYNMPPMYGEPDAQTMHRFDQNRMTNTDKSIDTTERPVLKEDLVPEITRIVENDAGEFINVSANSSHNSQNSDPAAVNNNIAEKDSDNDVSILERTASKVDEDSQEIYTSNNLRAAQELTDSKNVETDQGSVGSKKAVVAKLALSNQNIDFSELVAEVTTLDEITDHKVDAGLQILNENIAATLTFENNGVDEEFAAETNENKENITLKNFKVSTLEKEENIPEKKKCKASVLSSTPRNANPSDVVESTVLTSTPRRTRTNQNVKYAKGRKKSSSFHDLVEEINIDETNSCTICYVQLSPVDVEHSISAYTRTKSGAGSSSFVPRSPGNNASRIKPSNMRSYLFQKEKEVLIQHSTSVDEGNHASLSPAVNSRKRSRTFLNENIVATLTFENNGVDEEFAAETNENKENITLKNFKVSTLEKEENIPEKKKCKASVLSSTPRNANPSDVVESTVLTSTPRRTRTNQNVKYAKGRKKSSSFHDLVEEIKIDETNSCTICYVQLSPVDVEYSLSAYTRTKSGAGSSSFVPRSPGNNASRIKPSNMRSYLFQKEKEVLIQHSTSVDEGNHASLPPAVNSRKRIRTILPLGVLFNKSNSGMKEDTCVMRTRNTDDENLKLIDSKINQNLDQEEEITVLQQNEGEEKEVSIIEQENERGEDVKINQRKVSGEEDVKINQRKVSREEDVKINQRKVSRDEDVKIKQRKVSGEENVNSNQKKARGKKDTVIYQYEVEEEEVSTIDQKKVRGKEIAKIKQKKSELEKVGKIKQKNVEGNKVEKIVSPDLLLENCIFVGCNRSFRTNTGLTNHLRSHFKDELKQERKHEQGRETVFSCNLCFKQFTLKCAHKIHFMSKHKEYVE
ncbi:uncharacterized protein LOC111708795 isoform X1 [Eurytemora carolleeae]|uniref:uncharacterized protein LOC111708795 isoform X1 n=1 Tax=Eurytemora carolleeae TaxID=1294199 RepID=UPI000C7741DE|nr:uncharacterized protein LOC111708795 isoform X1 [Eurytemora carolleeae]|eukprot:XP_023338056.1 uncharacterized protein LOC111708795 isoform X1 [Eurytemora affinis]